jgi:transcription-repair coupling factor (superfamily II helicase)
MAISQMVPGDIVVHADHGVAEFRGIQTMKAGAHTREYLLLQYAGTDKLYVPTDQVHKVSKYIGMEGVSPRIHSLNSKIWVNQKRRVSKNVEAIAKELLELYAKRHAGVGFAFNQDCDLQRGMENQFPFVETPDQMKAITSTKEDMETAVPMDRLICGDVGYGKTEVAMRAAFKSVCSGRQVAFLAPTTLLAFQHYQTFIKRMGDFPVSIDMVSRLRKPAEQRETIRKLKEGSLDILIGTHRLLSKDIEFSRLGLLIVDEEQRFGVKHKERLKQLKTNIDVLTLTATPIPRTMQMAMAGIRQISVIDTPPRDRRPIQTYVAPFDPSWIKRAIIDEMKRGGQIFYVFNRVEQIEQKAAFLRELVPEARIEIAHGQMAEQKVEKTMLSFIKREFDVLIATTIIESGLDIPNANTLIVDDAQRLGLSQMYQLRGRVGRSNRQAWAYFFYSKGKKLTKEAKERLETIEEHTSLGSGFKIALRDLQIRGAGNILGSSQSGHISSIGFTLYMELLEEAVSKLKGGTPASPKVESAVEIPITALFPHSYIADEETRVELYARLSRCFELDAIDLIKAECEDRFGPLPDESRGLFIITTLRILASKAGIGKITRIMNRLRFELVKDRKPNMAVVMTSGANFVRQMALNPKDPDAIFLELRSEKIEDIYLLSKDFLTTLAEVPNLEDITGVN